MAEKTGAGHGAADNRSDRGAPNRDAESTWGANEKRKRQWDDKHGDAARKDAERANEEA